jgi:hypothetical protein
MTDFNEYATKLKAMTDNELVEETEQMVWLSAYANNNPRSAYHKQCDMCADACYNRRKPWLYSKGYNRAYESAGHRVTDRSSEKPEHWTQWLADHPNIGREK